MLIFLILVRFYLIILGIYYTNRFFSEYSITTKKSLIYIWTVSISYSIILFISDLKNDFFENMKFGTNLI